MRSPLDSPAATVAGLAATGGRLVLVSGTRGTGKTTWCSRVVAEARANGLGVAGVLSPHVLHDGVRVAIDLLDVTTGERHRLASRRDPAAAPPTPPAAPLPRAHWIFDRATLVWGNEVLDRAGPTDLLVIDELGVLEFGHDEGLASGLRRTDERAYGTACVVVRPELLDRAHARWPWAETRWAGEP